MQGNLALSRGEVAWWEKNRQSREKEGYQLITFLDEILRVNEERDYLNRIASHPETYSKAGFDEKLHCFGTLTMVYKIKNQEVVIKKISKNKEKPEMGAFQIVVFQNC